MARPVKRRHPAKGAKSRPSGAPATDGNAVEQTPALLRRGKRESVEVPLDDFSDDVAAQYAWLLERDGADMQRDDH